MHHVFDIRSLGRELFWKSCPIERTLLAWNRVRFAYAGGPLTNFKKCDIIELKGGREGPLREPWPLNRSGLDKFKNL